MTLPGNRELGSIFNNDINNIWHAVDSRKPVHGITADYRRALDEILDAKPGVLAQNVGLPDPVIYRSKVATPFDRYQEEVHRIVWPDSEYSSSSADAHAALLATGSDPFVLTVEACRERGVSPVASYRMNAEDWYHGTYLLSDFGRAHPEWRIPLTEEERLDAAKGGKPREFAGCLDPAVPEVYRHRMQIFREVAENYDIDGIEFDFRRWCRMISDPLTNHPVLTKMVADTRRMLDDVSKSKGRDRMILGVRVGPSLDTPKAVANYPGASHASSNPSCKELGLDVATWIEKELVDYVCPTLFWPRWPGHPYTREFVELAKGKKVGIYPTLFPMPGWLSEDTSPNKDIEPEDTKRLAKYKEGFCEIALKMYKDGADGISTFNWYFHLHLAKMPNQWQKYYGYGMGGSAVQKYVLSILGDPVAIRRYREQAWFWPAT